VCGSTGLVSQQVLQWFRCSKRSRSTC